MDAMTATAFLEQLAEQGGAIVRADQCAAEEIDDARAEDRHFVDEQGYEYIRRKGSWLDWHQRIEQALEELR